MSDRPPKRDAPFFPVPGEAAAPYREAQPPVAPPLGAPTALASEEAPRRVVVSRPTDGREPFDADTLTVEERLARDARAKEDTPFVQQPVLRTVLGACLFGLALVVEVLWPRSTIATIVSLCLIVPAAVLLPFRRRSFFDRFFD